MGRSLPWATSLSPPAGLRIKLLGQEPSLPNKLITPAGIEIKLPGQEPSLPVKLIAPCRN